MELLKPLNSQQEVRWRLNNEQNKVNNNGSEISMGGVRVKKTIYSDGNDAGKNVTTEYKYINEDGTTSGWGYDQPIYQQSTPVRIWKCGDAKSPAINYGQAISVIPSAVANSAASSLGGQILGAVGSLFAAIAFIFLINLLADILSPNFEDYTVNNISSYAINYSNSLPFQYSRVEVKSTQQANNNGKIMYAKLQKQGCTLAPRAGIIFLDTLIV